MISENTQEFNDSIDSSPTESGNVDDQDTWLCCCVLLITELSKCLTAGVGTHQPLQHRLSRAGLLGSMSYQPWSVEQHQQHRDSNQQSLPQSLTKHENLRF